jgi:hypothetical protein
MPSKPNVSQLVETARPVVTRLAEDEELRESLKSAFGSAQRVYAGLNTEPTRRGAAFRLAADPELQGELQEALNELRHASELARKPPSRSRGKSLFLFGAVVAFAFLNPITGPTLRDMVSNLVSRRSSGELDYSD